MNEETIFGPNGSEESPLSQEQEQNEEMTLGEETLSTEKPRKKERRKENQKMAAATGIGGVVGAGLGVLIPKIVFPMASDEDSSLEGDDELEEVEAPTSSGHLTGHDMDVATSVDDSMSFNQAFAAARHEVGAGGLFMWHGHTYGTYYANEWNSMTPEDKDQYWADVFHTTAQINHDSSELSEEENIAEGDGLVNSMDEESQADLTEDENHEGANDSEESLTDPQESAMLDEEDGFVDHGEELTDDSQILILDEEDIIEESDMDGDGLTDAILADVEGDDALDLVLDLNGDGQFDTVLVDPVEDEEGNLLVNVENIHGIGGIEVVPNGELHDDIDELVLEGDAEDDIEGDLALIDPESNGSEDEVGALDDEGNDVMDDGIDTENPDVDELASIDFDPDITIDNDMNMDDFV